MATDQLTLGPVPSDENCQQVGTPTYDALTAREECQRYITLLRELFGLEPIGARLVITSNPPHDFGTYFEVAVKYDDEVPRAVEYAFAVKKDLPTTWDDTRVRVWA